MQEKNKDILKKIAKKIDVDSESTACPNDDKNGQYNNSNDESNHSFFGDSDRLDKFLKRKSGLQNLEERKKLLDILKLLFIIQLVFMNIVVLFIVIWVVFKFEIFNSINTELLKEMLSFMKYYISAVLAELLGAIVYVIHRVFSAKIY